MENYILVGDFEKRRAFIELFIQEHEFASYEIEKYEGKMAVDDVRKIKLSLSFKTQKRLIIITAKISIEAQNAFLKSLEEAPKNCFFVLSTEKLEDFLPTIRSRCVVKFFVAEEVLENSVLDSAVKNLAQNENFFESIDLLEQEVKNEGLNILQERLRILMLDNCNSTDILRYYLFSKKFLKLSSLSENNNVQLKVVLEKVFSSNSPIDKALQL